MSARGAKGPHMTITRTRIALVAGVAALAAAAPRAAHAAEAFYGVAGGNTLVTFHSDAPGAIRTAAPITGLQAGEQVLALDVRPASGQLYALGSTSRLYILSPVSGAARPLGDPFTPPLAGTNFGFDFNPAVDRIRLVSDGRQNLRLNPDGGVVAAQDPALDYREGDPGAGSNPQVGAATYTNDGATLLAIDAARNALLAIDPPNDGKLRTVGPLGLDLNEPISFDVASDNTAYVSGSVGGGPVSLFSADVATGTLTDTGSTPISGRYGTVRAITATGPVENDTTKPAFLLGADRHQPRKKLRKSIGVPVSCNEACAIAVRLEYRERRIASGTGALDGPGRVTLRLRPTDRGKRLGAGKGELRGVLRVRVTDAAGNLITGRRTVVFK
jgi:hypothetical protein